MQSKPAIHDDWAIEQKISQVQAKSLWKLPTTIYLISWLVVYLEMPVAVHLLCMLVFIGLCLRSLNDATSIFLLFLFMPFYYDFLGIKVSGLNAARIMAFVYLYSSLRVPPLRALRVNRLFIILLLVSLISIFLSAEVRKIVQEMPIENSENSSSLMNFLARLFDISIMLLFIYLSLTRLKLSQIGRIYDLILLYGLLEALTIIFLVIQSPESIIGDQFDKTYLWRNPYFGHKNDWGMMLVFIVLAAFMKEKISQSNKPFYYSVMIFCTIGVVISLSRQAYISLIIGFLLSSFLLGNIKPAFYITLILFVLISLQPAFLFERLDTMMNVGSVEDFQNISRKVGDLAINQFKSNLTIIPRIFINEYEYNWSEGFYNGLAHQQGLIGLIFQLIFYFYLIYRYFLISKSNINELHNLGSKMCVFMILVVISNFNRRGINFMHYDGMVEQFGFVLMFFTFITEFALYHYKNLVQANEVDTMKN